MLRILCHPVTSCRRKRHLLKLRISEAPTDIVPDIGEPVILHVGNKKYDTWMVKSDQEGRGIMTAGLEGVYESWDDGDIPILNVLKLEPQKEFKLVKK